MGEFEGKRKAKVKDENGSIHEVDIKDLSNNPIIHTSLDDSLLLRIGVIFNKFKPYLKSAALTLEQFEIGFMRDEHPENEVNMWEDILITFEIAMEIYGDREGIDKIIYECLIMNAIGAFTPEEEDMEFVTQIKNLYAKVVKARREMQDESEY